MQCDYVMYLVISFRRTPVSLQSLSSLYAEQSRINQREALDDLPPHSLRSLHFRSTRSLQSAYERSYVLMATSGIRPIEFEIGDSDRDEDISRTRSNVR